MSASKVLILAVFVISVIVANVHCAPESVGSERLPTRVRRQLPQLPSIPGADAVSQIPGLSIFKNAGNAFAKNIPGADTITSQIPGLTQTSQTAALKSDDSIARFKREARGTGHLPTKTG